jgi:CelD/BcsL family acetyltransferase involved in cellulose biosynthesis
VTGITVELVDDAAELARLAGPWQALWRRVPTATPFQSPGWLLPWWQCFLPGDLAVVAVWNDKRLIGLAPFYLAHGAEGRILTLGIGVSDYLDFLIEPRFAPISLDTFLDPLLGHLPPWQSCILEEIPPWSKTLQLQPPGACRHFVETHSACPVLELSQAIPAGMQRRLRRGARRAQRRGGLDIRSVDGSKVDGFLDALFLLHGARWRDRDAQSGVFSDAAVRAFHRHALPSLHKAGIARLYELHVGGKIAGCYYGFSDRGRAYAYIGGFDPDFANVSPGGLLLAHAIEEAQREGGSEFHFLRGRESYKYEWGAVDRWNKRLRFERAVGHDNV